MGYPARMSDLVSVRHPIVHRFVPSRGRVPRIGLTEGTTAYRLRHLGESPREVARIGGEKVFGADGAAWMGLVDHGSPATAKRLSVLLEHGALATRGNGFVEPYHRTVERSPLHYRDDSSHLPPRGSTPGPRDTIVEDGTERASLAVPAFLDDTFRLHEGQVLVRFRHLVMASDIHRSAPRLQTRTYPRTAPDKDQLGLRHDRIGELVALMGPRTRLKDAEAQDWRGLLPIPAELLDDHDIEYAANALPARLRLLMGYWEQCEARNERRARIHAAIPGVRRLAEDAHSHAVTGDRVEPALALMRDMLGDIVAEQKAWDSMMMKRTPSPAHAATAVMHAMLDRVYLPRWRMGSDVAPEDDAALGRLAI